MSSTTKSLRCITVDAFGEVQSMPWGPPPGPGEGPSRMILGAAYNVFDNEELLEASVRSIRSEVDFVAIVYQRTSNFGAPCSAELMPTLGALRDIGLVDELIEYAPRTFTLEEKKKLISRRATDQHLGGTSVTDLGEQFFNELTKREVGRRACAARDCNYFMSMDCDEFYHAAELRAVKALTLRENYECVCCYMRTFFKWPTEELVPAEEANCVPVLYRILEHLPFRLACPYPCLVDPTRKLENLRRLHVAGRSVVQMHHFSFVRRHIRSKLLNVSNRGNYAGGGAPEALELFARRFEAWQPSHGVLHPHPYYQQAFKRTACVPNWFGIDASQWGQEPCERVPSQSDTLGCTEPEPKPSASANDGID